ncbi:PWWP domain-containing DNA repair factor 3A isoform X2 [Mugil cephalus]|uniref:PWWP domain-containing DNA repair factor 3A isoform X2 n=1 Tax=Mugil cephalus TaxID=48193 RepID=UPI001FB7B6A9|nr:PWWP domain-containing DNA repair factor 3A isoform X2 [Mugil cephalus]
MHIQRSQLSGSSDSSLELKGNLSNERTTTSHTTMRGAPRKARKREPRKTTTKEVSPDKVSATKESSAVSGFDMGVHTASSLPSTPKRRKGQRGQQAEASLTSTPVHSSSTDILSNITGSPPEVKPLDLGYTEIITQLKTAAVDSPSSKAKSSSRHKRVRESHPRQVRQRMPKEKTHITTNGPPAKSRRGRKPKTETGKSKHDPSSASSERSRPRFELAKPVSEETALSSDLSIELSRDDEQLPPLSFQTYEESDEEEEEEELPSFLMQVDKKPPSIIEGVFVWCKFRQYPFWPAWVKNVYRKQKKASIVFIDGTNIQQKKGITVGLKSLKPFDCEEASELMRQAKEEYEATINWASELIDDYMFRIACGSFSGSFIKYFDHHMSYPVRKKYSQAASEGLTIASDTTEDACDDHRDGSFSEQQEDIRSSKRLLPDRTHAAHNRANEKLVHFIVKQRMVEGHLLAVIHGQQQSRWLHSFLSAKQRRIVNIYLEDDHQLDQVYLYLNELYETAVASAPCQNEVTFMERVPFILDVLLPEAIINAIAGVDNVSIKKAEEKYLKGRRVSNREREEFDLMIERQIRERFQHQKTKSLLVSDPVG